MAKDPETLAHLEWLGYVQPVGLVVSIPALLSAQAHVNRNIAAQHGQFLTFLPRDKDGVIVPEIRDFAEITQKVFNWRETDLEAVKPGDDKYLSLEVHLPVYHETLRPTHVVREYQPKNPGHPWMVLIQEHPTGSDFDKATEAEGTHWVATPQAKFERLLRETNVPIGLLVSPNKLRLVYAPRGESSGYMTFSVAEMAQIAGRAIFAALVMLFSDERLFSLGEKQRLPAILADSRKYQNHVSNELAQQVLAALYELLRGFQAADDAANGELLRKVLADNPNHVYGGLLTVLMRLVFVLYAEDRDLISNDPVYSNHYSLTGLFERLRADAGRYPDTMDSRYGSWAQLLTLFRLVYEGGSHGNLKIPARKGYLFDPDRYPFLEGCTTEEKKVPRIPDGVIFRVLENLLILDGERLSYRTLDVEQIGSVYETMMGFAVEVAKGRSIAIKPKKSHGAPTTINLEELLEKKAADRGKWLKETTDQDLTGTALTGLKDAKSVDDLLVALEKKIARNVTPNVAAKGSMIFQPSDERRRSGSHYTPRSLTEPIVRKALEPVLMSLLPSPSAGVEPGMRGTKPTAEIPTPQQILDLKICDPAMGSGAFLVEACRQLGELLVKSWHAHNCLPTIPPDEDELLHAQRLVAQRCLYGVDKNPMAVDLAKMSLWLATLAKEHPFTFIDHALRCGDSLVGLTAKQIAEFRWDTGKYQRAIGQNVIEERIQAATASRLDILNADEYTVETFKEQKLKLADESLNLVRFTGNLVVAAFFAADKDTQREQKRNDYLGMLSEYLRGNVKLPPSKEEAAIREGEKPVLPFHWDIEFPEVFGRKETGFDVMIGNPPFLGGRSISTNYGDGYTAWLTGTNEGTAGGADLVAFFFRRAFGLIRKDGTFGLITTNTISQGDTRSSGLRWICTHGGTIYAATRRYKWPGQAAVVVSVLHIVNGPMTVPFDLDGRPVDRITAYLFHAGGHDDPAKLRANEDKSFQGSIVLGMGFTFDDADNSGVASPASLMRELVAKDKRNAEHIFPYIGGEEVNDSPRHTPIRHVVNFGEMSLDQAKRWPDLVALLEQKAKPERSKSKSREVRDYSWWLFWRPRTELYSTIQTMPAVLLAARHQPHWAVARSNSQMVFSDALNIFALPTHAAHAVLQSRPHEVWARFFASSLEDRLRYTPSDCFETFPFPNDFESNAELERVGKEYYEYRADLMVRNDEGLTKTYNRFHDPNERSPEIAKLRDLHDRMDRAVLKAYGPPFSELIVPKCEFILDYEDDEEESETPGKRQKKKPWRYRWPDEFRDEVLALLLELNKQRAEEERLSGEAAALNETKPKKAKTPKAPKKADVATKGDLFEQQAAQERIYILLLLRAWNKPVTRNALECGLVLMLNDDIRKGLQKPGKAKAKSGNARVVEGLNYVLQELETQGYLKIEQRAQQRLTILPDAPPFESHPEEDNKRLREVKKIFEQEKARNMVVETAEYIDAKRELISVG